MSADSAALFTVEQRVRSLVAARLETVTNHYGAYLAAVIREAGPITAAELLSRADMHTALTGVLAGAAAASESAVRAAYKAGANLGRTAATEQLGEKASTGDLGGYIDSVVADVHTAFAGAELDIQNSIREAHNGVVGTATTAVLILVTAEALRRAVRRLAVRITSAAVAAVYRGFTDALVFAMVAYAATHPYLSVTKRWEASSQIPCPACAALDGTVLPLDGAFDASATTDPNFSLPKVYWDLHGPPRHPNCRCRLVVETSDASKSLKQQITKRPPVRYSYLTAAQVRRMPTAKYTALLSFLKASLRMTAQLLRKIRRGG